MKIKSIKFFKIIAIALCFFMVFEQSGFAQVTGELDLSSHFLSLRNTFIQDKFRPLHLRYLSYDPSANNFNLLLDKGDSLKGLPPQGTDPEMHGQHSVLSLQEETKRLLQYFFIGISLPNEAFWVNLRPDAEDNIIDSELAETDVGKILLEADLQLKKDTANFTSPQTPEGKEYWDKLYKKAEELYGSENITIPTLTRPWIVPDEIIIRESKDNAYIYKATLKVMLEQDYLKDSSTYNFKDQRSKALNEYSSELIRKTIIPKLIKEVNSSKRYAPLRQVYYSLILAQWFKQRFKGLSPQGTVPIYIALIDRKNLNGLTSKQPWSKTTYFNAYKTSFQQGEYNIKEPRYTPYGQTIKSYMSGGIAFASASSAIAQGVVPRKRNAEAIPIPTYGLVVNLEGGTVSSPFEVTIEAASPADINTQTAIGQPPVAGAAKQIGEQKSELSSAVSSSPFSENRTIKKMKDFFAGFSKKQMLYRKLSNAIRRNEKLTKIKEILLTIFGENKYWLNDLTRETLETYELYPEGFARCVDAGFDLINELRLGEVTAMGVRSIEGAQTLRELAKVFQFSQEKGKELLQTTQDKRRYKYTRERIWLEKDYGEDGVRLARVAEKAGFSETEISNIVLLAKVKGPGLSGMVKWLEEVDSQGKNLINLVDDLRYQYTTTRLLLEQGHYEHSLIFGLSLLVNLTATSFPGEVKVSLMQLDENQRLELGLALKGIQPVSSRLLAIMFDQVRDWVYKGLNQSDFVKDVKKLILEQAGLLDPHLIVDYWLDVIKTPSDALFHSSSDNRNNFIIFIGEAINAVNKDIVIPILLERLQKTTDQNIIDYIVSKLFNLENSYKDDNLASFFVRILNADMDEASYYSNLNNDGEALFALLRCFKAYHYKFGASIGGYTEISSADQKWLETILQRDKNILHKILNLISLKTQDPHDYPQPEKRQLAVPFIIMALQQMPEFKPTREDFNRLVVGLINHYWQDKGKYDLSIDGSSDKTLLLYAEIIAECVKRNPDLFEVLFSELQSPTLYYELTEKNTAVANLVFAINICIEKSGVKISKEQLLHLLGIGKELNERWTRKKVGREFSRLQGFTSAITVIESEGEERALKNLKTTILTILFRGLYLSSENEHGLTHNAISFLFFAYDQNATAEKILSQELSSCFGRLSNFLKDIGISQATIRLIIASLVVKAEPMKSALETVDNLEKYKEWLKENHSLLGEARLRDLLLDGQQIIIDFIMSENNKTMITAKADLAERLIILRASEEIVSYILQQIELTPRGARLAFLRGLNNILPEAEMAGKTLEDWRMLLENYVVDFGFLAQNDLIKIYRLLYYNEPLEGAENALDQYDLPKLGITHSGKEGIAQLKNLINEIRRKILENKDIDEGNLDHPLIKSLVGEITGFYTAVWGHGSNRNQDLMMFVRRFHTQQDVASLDAGLSANEGAFPVRKLGRIEFTADEKAMFERYKSLAQESVDIIRQKEKEAHIDYIREITKRVIQQEIDVLRNKLDNQTNEKAKENIASQISLLESTRNSLESADSLVGIIAILVDKINKIVEKSIDLQDIAIISLLVETFSQYPELAEAMRGSLQNDISLSAIERIIELKDTFLKEHILIDIDKETSKKILRLFRIRIFEEARDRVKALTESIAVNAFITKGILGEMAGDIGDACYTAQPDIMRYPTMEGAVIFTTGENLEKQLIGSMLLLKNSINGKKAWILRAINPQEKFISEYSTEDFLKGMIEYITACAISYNRDKSNDEKIYYIVVPVPSTGALSNRGTIQSSIAKMASDETVPLDQEEEFNGYNIKESCKTIVSIDIAASPVIKTAQPLAAGSPVAKEEREVEHALRDFINSNDLQDKIIYSFSDGAHKIMGNDYGYGEESQWWMTNNSEFYDAKSQFFKSLPVELPKSYKSGHKIAEGREMVQSIDELFKNAYDAILSYYYNREPPEDYRGEIRVSLSIKVSAKDGKMLVITVTDNGLGANSVPTEQKKKCMFFMGRDNIGLGMVEKIVKDNGGIVDVKIYQKNEDAAGVGARVKLEIPLKKLALKNKNTKIAGSPVVVEKSISPAAQRDLGGIDMRSLSKNMVIQPMAAAIPLNQGQSPSGTVPVSDKEWEEIERMANSGIAPSCERLREYLLSLQDPSTQIDKVLACIADILRQEEEKACCTESSLREILVLLESDKPVNELRLALAKVQVLAKEPQLIEQ